jgi:hypothetical protein
MPIPSLAGVYKLVAHMFRHGKQHAPGALVELTHEEASEGLAQGTITKPTAADQKAATERAAERAGLPTGDESLGGGSPPEVIEATRLRAEAEAKAAADKAEADRAEAERLAAEQTQGKTSTEPPTAGSSETTPESKGGKKAK